MFVLLFSGDLRVIVFSVDDCYRAPVVPGVDMVLCCFDVRNRVSMDNIRDQWQERLGREAPGVPVVLVGTKIDLRDDSKESISVAEARKFAQEMGYVDYVECSALKEIGVREVIEGTARRVLKMRVGKKNTSGRCAIL